MKLRIGLSVVALFAACGTASGAGINLVANGSFELGTLGIGSFQGWQTNTGDISTFVDSSGQTGPHYGEASDGLWAAYFGSTAADGGATISQTLATTVNQVYLLSFDLANDNGGLSPVNSFAVSVGSATPFSVTSAPDQDYRHYQFFFVASGTATQLRFAGSNDNSYFELDHVVVAATPEPATRGLSMVGGLAIVFAFRGFGRRARVNSN